jgi:hypothetical protein
MITALPENLPENLPAWYGVPRGTMEPGQIVVREQAQVSHMAIHSSYLRNVRRSLLNVDEGM